MTLTLHPAATRTAAPALRLLSLALLLTGVSQLHAQTAPITTPMPVAPSAAAPPVPTSPTASKPSIAGTDAPPTRQRALERLINRDLILQQVKLQPLDPITEEDAAKDLDSLRKAIPTCKEFHCETKTGWDKFLASQGFTEATLTGLWQQRMVVLQFIEQRFRMGIKVTDQDIKDYYTTDLLPQYAKLNAPPPPLAAISSRIQEILLQQRVSSLLKDWLQSLRAQGSVVILHPGEEAP